MEYRDDQFLLKFHPVIFPTIISGKSHTFSSSSNDQIWTKANQDNQ